MARRGPYTVGGRTYATKAALGEAVRTILYAYPIGACVAGSDAAFLADLFTRHEDAERKIGVGIAEIRVAEDDFRGRRFELLRLDGTTTDISYKKCLCADAPLTVFSDTARKVVAPQVISFKQRYTPEGTPWALVHVHHVVPFRQVLQDFVQQEGGGGRADGAGWARPDQGTRDLGLRGALLRRDAGPRRDSANERGQLIRCGQGQGGG